MPEPSRSLPAQVVDQLRAEIERLRGLLKRTIELLADSGEEDWAMNLRYELEGDNDG